LASLSFLLLSMIRSWCNFLHKARLREYSALGYALHSLHQYQRLSLYYIGDLESKQEEKIRMNDGVGLNHERSCDSDQHTQYLRIVSLIHVLIMGKRLQ
jgi:hypothetical protein